MKTQLSSTTATSIEQIADRIVASGRITRADERFFLRAALSETPLGEAEMNQINRVLHRLQMGLLKVID